MNYTNRQAVRFKIYADRGRYTVRCYSNRTNRPSHYMTYDCSSDNLVREMLFILNDVKMCPDCHHRPIRTYEVCPECRLVRMAQQPLHRLEYCQVCYIAVFEADRTRCPLTCPHLLCPVCKINLQDVDWTRNQMVINCPECHIKTWI
jgi:hypothetical protein